MFFDDDVLDECFEEEKGKNPAKGGYASEQSPLPAAPVSAAGGGAMPQMPPVPSSIPTGKVSPTKDFVDLTDSIGLKFRIMLDGPPSGPPLVYVPGTLMDMRKEFDRGSVKSLAKTFRLLVVDQRNCGETRPFTWETKNATTYNHIATYADDVAAVANAVFGPSVKFDVAGFSSGAGIALWVAHRYPDRVRKVLNLSGGFFPNREVELAGDDLSDDLRLIGKEDIGWFTDLVCMHDKSYYSKSMNMKEHCGKILAHVDKRYSLDWQKQNAAICESMFQSMEADERVHIDSPDFNGLCRGGRYVEAANFVCGSPPLEGLQKLGANAMICASKFDNMHQASKIEGLIEKMPGARVEWFPEGHNCVTRATGAIVDFLTK